MDDQENGWQTLERRFPVVLKYGGFLGALVATIATFMGVEFAAPLLALFGSMMGIGQLADAMRTSRRPPDTGETRR